MILNLLRRWRNHSSRTSPPRWRPQLEWLEDRLTPAAPIVVATFADVVKPGGGLSLREAITKANATAEPDVILLSAGVCKIALDGAGENDNHTGDFDVTNPLTIKGDGPTATFIDGASLD